MKSVRILWTIFLLFLLAPLCYADKIITFEKTFGGSSYDGSSSVEQTSDGGYIICGSTESYGTGGRDVYLIKTDKYGNILWEKTFGGNEDDGGKSVKQTNDGGYIICGYTCSFSSGGSDVYLIKTDNQGNKLWEKTFGGKRNDWANSISNTSDGGYIICGAINNSRFSGYTDIYLLKIDNQGNKLWEEIFDSNMDEFGYAVIQINDGGYIISGSLETQAHIFDVYIIKTDNHGNKLLEKTFGSDATDYSQSIQQTDDGGYIICGCINVAMVGPDVSDVYLLKVDSHGEMIWEKAFGGGSKESGASVKQTNDGGYIICGYTCTFGAGKADVYLIKTDNHGEMIWEKTFGDSEVDTSSYVIQTEDGGYIICGSTKSYGAGEYDIYLIKTDSQGNVDK